MPGSRRVLLRSFWISMVTVPVLMAAIWFGGRAWMGHSVMDYEGTASLHSLDAEVEILFDARGIPRIYASTDSDAFQALGWLHAGERLFQMELIRRLARGELAELFGRPGLELDLVSRPMGFAQRIADERPTLDPATLDMVSAYVNGINRKIETLNRLPPEFALLRHEPEPWRIEDVMAIAYYQSFYATTLVQRMSEAWRAVVESYGDEARQWLEVLDGWARPTMPTFSLAEGSNTWVISPERSLTGAALHASDPHLEYDVAPGMWYAAGLHSAEGLNLVGVTAPGMPFVAMGHNGRIAWAFTVAPVDVFEIWRFPRDPDDPELLLTADGPERLHRRSESFKVRGNDRPLTREFQYSPRGRVLEMTEDEVLVMQWVGFELPVAELLDSAMAIHQASNFDEFRAAASQVGALSVNWSYSDRDGNIGYVQSSAIPVRRHRHHFAVLDGMNPDHGWDGFYPPEQRPYALNPDQGWLANANNHAVDGNWPHPIPGFYKHLRKRRISDHLSDQENFSPADMHRFQLDRTSDRALSWKDWLADTATATGRDRLGEEIRAWDGVMRTDSEIAGLFIRWWHYLPRALFDGDKTLEWRTMQVVFDEWLHAGPSAVPAPQRDLDEAARLALDDALRPGLWPLGMIQDLTIRHPMAQAGLLDRWLRLTRGPIPMGGDAGSLNVTYASFNPESARLRARAGASMRYVMDWSDPDSFTLNLTLGQSGNPFSPHFDDFLPDFLSGQPWTVPWTQEAVEAASTSKLTLRPR
ncbi:MAG: penicillin acylase family protein [Wenzhouxiangella sp.]|nr:MAG: penicillin acylase family protein [Wenzhouxiangella sp.]